MARRRNDPESTSVGTREKILEEAEELIARLDVHLAEHPFLLGGRPGIVAFALRGTRWAHMYRDPGATGLSGAYVGVAERAQRKQVTYLFSRFLRPAVADEIWRQRAAFMQQKRNQETTEAPLAAP